jgi:hypothetical protein
MIKEMIFMQFGSYSGGDLGDILAGWEQAGVFSYALPFLVIFALVFGILNQIQLFKKNRAVNAIIALAVGLMALQFEFVPTFFAEVLPRMGVGLMVILVILILVGLFVDPEKSGIMWTLLGIGVVVAIVVLINAGAAVGWSTGYWWEDNWGTILGIIVFLVIIGLIIGSGAGSGGPKKPGKGYSPFWVRTD